MLPKSVESTSTSYTYPFHLPSYLTSYLMFICIDISVFFAWHFVRSWWVLKCNNNINVPRLYISHLSHIWNLFKLHRIESLISYKWIHKAENETKWKKKRKAKRKEKKKELETPKRENNTYCVRSPHCTRRIDRTNTVVCAARFE